MANDKNLVIKNGMDVSGGVVSAEGPALTDTSTSVYYRTNILTASTRKNDITTSMDRAFTVDDGDTKYYVSTNQDIRQSTMSTAGDLRTLNHGSYDTFSTGGSGTIYAIGWKPEGDKFFLTQENKVRIWNKSGANNFELNSLSDTVHSEFTGASNSDFLGITFKPDGLKFFLLIDETNDVRIEQFELTTAWDLSTASRSSSGTSYAAYQLGYNDGTSSKFLNLGNMVMNGDGTQLLIASRDAPSREIYNFVLDTAWDINTLRHVGFLDKIELENNGTDATTGVEHISWGSDGSKLYGGRAIDVRAWSTKAEKKTADLSKGNYFKHTLTEDTEIAFTNPSQAQSFLVEIEGDHTLPDNMHDWNVERIAQGTCDLEEVTPNNYLDQAIYSAKGATASPDGRYLYVLRNSPNEQGILQYELFKPYALGQLYYGNKGVSTVSLTSDLENLVFKPDGTKLYSIDPTTQKKIYAWNLSTAWDVSTATIDANEVKTFTDTVHVLAFKPDGLRAIVGDGSTLYQYTLSTAWNLTTASKDTPTLNISATTTDVHNIFFNSTGTRLYVKASSSGDFETWELPTAYTLTAGSQVSSPYDSSTDIETMFDISFESDINGSLAIVGNYLFMVANKTAGVETRLWRLVPSYQVSWDQKIKWSQGRPPPNPLSGYKNVYSFTTYDNGTSYIGGLVSFNVKA